MKIRIAAEIIQNNGGTNSHVCKWDTVCERERFMGQG